MHTKTGQIAKRICHRGLVEFYSKQDQKQCMPIYDGPQEGLNKIIKKNKESIPTRAVFFLGHIDTPKNAVKTQDTRSKTDSRFSRVSLNSFSKKS